MYKKMYLCIIIPQIALFYVQKRVHLIENHPEEKICRHCRHIKGFEGLADENPENPPYALT